MTSVPVTTMSVGRYLRVVVPDGEADWRDLAVCAQTDPDVFFPEKGGSIRQAKAVCAVCPVTAPCLEYALERGALGIWAGTSRAERKQMGRPAGTPALRDCKAGLHVMTPENIYTAPDGAQTCRLCKEARSRRRPSRARAVAA